MRLLNAKLLIGGAVAALLVAGAAEAATAKIHTMKVSEPDGSVVEVHYTGKVAPQVQFVPATQMDPARYSQVQPVAYDPFAQMDRIDAMMDAQMHAMMQRAAVMQQQAAQMHQRMIAASASSQSGAPGFVMTGNMPAGSHFTYVSSTTDANGCTTTVSYSSNGQAGSAKGQPKLTRVSSDSCAAAGAQRKGNTVEAKAEAPAPAAPQVGQKV